MNRDWSRGPRRAMPILNECPVRAPRRPTGRRPGFEPLEARALLATFTITGLDDAGPGSLRDAIERANLDPARDTITFAEGLSGTILLATPLPDLATPIDLRGPGSDLLTISRFEDPEDPRFRLLTVPEGSDVTIAGLTFSRGIGAIRNAGSLVIAESVIARNDTEDPFGAGGQAGGGVVNMGTLTVVDTAFTGNSTGDVFDGTGGSSFGGAIFNAGVLSITGSSFTGNVARAAGGIGMRRGSGSGGAIFNAGVMAIADTTFSGNLATLGGAIANAEGAEAWIVGATFTGNGASQGGAIDTRGTLSITESTLTGNAANGGLQSGGWTVAGQGGGIRNAGVLMIVRGTITENQAIGRPAFPSTPFLDENPSLGGGIASSGVLTLDDSTLNGNIADLGGAVAVESGLYRISDSLIHDNEASASGGGLDLSEGSSGAVLGSTFQSNRVESRAGVGPSSFAEANGGAIANRGALTVDGSRFLLNRVQASGGTTGVGRGGAIANRGSLTAVSSIFLDNTALAGGIRGAAGMGGAIANEGPLLLVGSTLAGNRAEGSETSGTGGALDHTGEDRAIVINSTLTENTAPSGAAISSNGPVLLAHVTITGNDGVPVSIFGIPPVEALQGSLAVISSIIDAGPFGESIASNVENGLASLGWNIFSDTPPMALGPNDLTQTLPNLGPLAANGGPTPTMALLPNSPAINAAIPVSGISTDQRGVARPRSSAPDAGAFEFGPFANPSPRTPADFDGDGRSDLVTYALDPGGFGRFAIEFSGGGSREVLFGGPDDQPVSGDFDGDGISDVAVFGFSPLDGFSRLAYLRSADGRGVLVPFGGPGETPVIADFDGDGISDLAVHGPGLDGLPRFAVLPSSDPNGAYLVPFGGPDDIPLAGDYDGDGLADLAVYGYIPEHDYSRFAIRPSSNPAAGYAVPFGGYHDRPVVMNVDRDTKTDLVIYGYSPDDGFSRFATQWSSQPTLAYARPFGGPGDRPVSLDTDGDGWTDLAVFGYSPDDGFSRFALRRSTEYYAIPIRIDGPQNMVAVPISPGQPLPKLPAPPPMTASAARRAGPIVSPGSPGVRLAHSSPRSDLQAILSWALLVDAVLLDDPDDDSTP